MDPREVFIQKELTCECGTCDFETYYDVDEKGISENYIFYSRCKTCGTYWSFASVVSHLGTSYDTPYFSDLKEITDKKWKMLEVDKKIPLLHH